MQIKSSFTFSPEGGVYTLKFKKKFPWKILWLLLFLLIFLIPVSDKINVSIIDKTDDTPIALSEIRLKYKKTSSEQENSYVLISNDEGKALFKINRRILFVYLFLNDPYEKIKYNLFAQKQGYLPDSLLAKSLKEIKTGGNLAVLKLAPVPDSIPKDEPQKPKIGCRAFFTGLVVGGKFRDRHISEVYKVDDYSEYVGEGEYPDNETAFPKAVATTFDGIAIDHGTRVIIYEEKNFKGKVLLDKTGPAIINNVKWKYDSRYSDSNTEDYPFELQKNFPQSVRYWSETDMQPWSYGSLKVICEKK